MNESTSPFFLITRAILEKIKHPPFKHVSQGALCATPFFFWGRAPLPPVLLHQDLVPSTRRNAISPQIGITHHEDVVLVRRRANHILRSSGGCVPGITPHQRSWHDRHSGASCRTGENPCWVASLIRSSCELMNVPAACAIELKRWRKRPRMGAVPKTKTYKPPPYTFSLGMSWRSLGSGWCRNVSNILTTHQTNTLQSDFLGLVKGIFPHNDQSTAQQCASKA